MILGIDPGAHTGVATFVAGQLVGLHTIEPLHIERFIRERAPMRVVFEDSRLQSHTWTKASSRAAAAKMARNVGQVDAWCSLINAVCAELGIPAHGISPAGKGGKLDAEAFKRKTGWPGKTNEHARDAAMVAWPYRGATNA
ncbi:hypothetical protein [Comamonas sp. B21-038]|uniref:hypothetical protein n=1 Tax=Comamonas sp. B21-038 TaxID=2918299 RepID=UPI001EFB6A7A|nr:hypothetical protein [Comamonas sp. B21-038]ULR90941.1 hypothetical protein MJ205_08880 [Comamonas sp. B21-038]